MQYWLQSNVSGGLALPVTDRFNPDPPVSHGLDQPDSLESVIVDELYGSSLVGGQ